MIDDYNPRTSQCLCGMPRYNHCCCSSESIISNALLCNCNNIQASQERIIQILTCNQLTCANRSLRQPIYQTQNADAACNPSTCKNKNPKQPQKESSQPQNADATYICDSRPQRNTIEVSRRITSDNLNGIVSNPRTESNENAPVWTRSGQNRRRSEPIPSPIVERTMEESEFSDTSLSSESDFPMRREMNDFEEGIKYASIQDPVDTNITCEKLNNPENFNVVKKRRVSRNAISNTPNSMQDAIEVYRSSDIRSDYEYDNIAGKRNAQENIFQNRASIVHETSLTNGSSRIESQTEESNIQRKRKVARSLFDDGTRAVRETFPSNRAPFIGSEPEESNVSRRAVAGSRFDEGSTTVQSISISNRPARIVSESEESNIPRKRTIARSSFDHEGSAVQEAFTTNRPPRVGSKPEKSQIANRTTTRSLFNEGASTVQDTEESTMPRKRKVVRSLFAEEVNVQENLTSNSPIAIESETDQSNIPRMNNVAPSLLDEGTSTVQEISKHKATSGKENESEKSKMSKKQNLPQHSTMQETSFSKQSSLIRSESEEMNVPKKRSVDQCVCNEAVRALDEISFSNLSTEIGSIQSEKPTPQRVAQNTLINTTEVFQEASKSGRSSGTSSKSQETNMSKKRKAVGNVFGAKSGPSGQDYDLSGIMEQGDDKDCECPQGCDCKESGLCGPELRGELRKIHNKNKKVLVELKTKLIDLKEILGNLQTDQNTFNDNANNMLDQAQIIGRSCIERIRQEN